MDSEPTRDQAPKIAPHPALSGAVPEPLEKAGQQVRKSPPEVLQFPGDDRGTSLAEMAEADLHAALQLLAERAQYITGASGVAIALRENESMICRASAGTSAPELGAHLQIDSGLSGESVRTRQSLRCDNVESDPRVNRESCRELGIASVVVMPLVREQQVNGVFELLSDRAYAFEERDRLAMERIAEMIQTAMEHTEAARRAQAAIAPEPEQEVADGIERNLDVKSDVGPEPEKVESTNVAPIKTRLTAPAKADSEAGIETPEADQRPITPLPDTGKIRKCEKCGFPVSEGRKLCLDCESAAEDSRAPSASSARQHTPDFLAQLSQANQPSWLRSHVYLVGTVLMAVLTAIILLWLR